MRIEDFFDHEFQIKYLKSLNFEIKETEVDCRRPAYHDDMAYWKETVLGVFFAGEERCKPSVGYGAFGRYTWVENAFQKVFVPQFQEFLLTMMPKY